MVTTFLILSAMFLTLFVIDIPLVYVVAKRGSKRQLFRVKISAALLASMCAICWLAALGVYLG